MIDKRDLILLNLSKGKVMTITALYKVMGYKTTTPVYKDLKILVQSGLVEELEWGICPGCGEQLVGLEIKKNSMPLRLTDEGVKKVETIKKTLKALL